jgi:transmembrane sensor
VTRVDVREGEVELMSRGQARNLKAGDMGTHDEATGQSRFDKADLQEAFAWQSAHAIYRNQPLSAVVKDLNRYYDKPIIVDPAAGQLRLNMIVTLDSQTAVAGRLGEFLPLEVRVSNEAIYLSRRSDTGSASGDSGRGG